MPRFWTVLVGLCLVPIVGASQAFAPRDSVTVVPGAQFKAGSLHRFFFGTHYRNLWTTPLRVPVLELKSFAGGLTPLQRGGGQQTASLRLRGADGKEYSFRSVAKDPSQVLPPELRETVAADIVKDQVSSAHPAGALVAAPLLEAAGVLHATPILVQFADDPALGEFRKEFAGLLGMIEERPSELADEGRSFAGASAIVGTADLFKALDEDPEVPVDARAFLLARLTDVFMGDWDRHADQWRWAKVARGTHRSWQPIPRDRDQAFVRLDGFLLAQARRTAPQLLNFGPEYGSITGATWNGRNLDRRFLTGLEKPVWDSIAALLQSRLTDRVIAQAVRSLPREHYAVDGARLEAALKSRRDQLPAIAGRYYRLLADVVDIFASDKPDSAIITRRADGATEVALSHRGANFFRRVFHPGETREVSLLMQGGGDRVLVDGTGRSAPTIRVVGGGGDDGFVVARSGGVKLYDERGTNQATGAGINTRAWRWRRDTAETDIRILPPRDWGRRTILLASGLFGPDVDAVLGYSGHTDWYGFRRVPFATRLDYGVEFSTGRASGRVNAGVTRQFENSSGFLKLSALASGIESLRWYGFGNESQQLVTLDDAKFYRLSQNELSASLRLGTRFGARSHLAVGPVLRWSDTDLGDPDNADRFIAQDNPYGTGMFGLIGVGAELVLEGRDHPHMATSGAALTISASGFGGWDAVKPVTRIDVQGSLALAPNGKWRPSLNLMAGGTKTTGPVPFFLAPTLGGIRTLRGYRPDRFAGEDALYGSVELRLPLTRIKLVVPGEQGIFAFSDAGRVYLEGEQSDEWHTTFGGGIWLSFLNRDNVVFAGMGKPGKGSEGARVIVGFGFPY